MNKSIFLFLLSLFAFQIQSQAQVSKNAIHVDAGFVGLGGGINGNYERVFYEGKGGLINTIAARVGGGVWTVWGGEGTNALTAVSALTGKQKHHFELVAGAAYLYDKESYAIGVSNATYRNEPLPKKTVYLDVLAVASVGYRYQKPSGGFLFRTGIGYPEGVYLGVGAAF